MNEVVLALRWYCAVQVCGFAVLPLALRLFRHLPDRGYGVSKPLGLLLAGWVFWLLLTLGSLHNTAGSVVVVIAGIAAAGVALHLAKKQASESLWPSWGVILTAEMVFALAFAAWCVVRANMPRFETAGGEKWMEIAFLRAILRSEVFPPHDPWLSGFAISYYYFGYIIVAMITQLAAVPPSIAFNLGCAMLFALTCTGAFGLVHSLVATERWVRRTGAILSGLLGPLLLAVTGNLEVLFEVLHTRGVGSPSFWKWLDVVKAPLVTSADGGWIPQRSYWWWQASRVIRDYTPWGDAQEVIDEFPAFSFLLGDMHPHVLALPFVLLALALAFNLYRRATLKPDPWQLKLLGWRISLPLAPWEVLVYGICLGGLGFLNTWDFPIYLFVVAAAYCLARLGRGEDVGDLASCVSHFARLFGVLLATGLLLYLPFWLTFKSQAGGILPNLFNGTRLHQFLIMFGPLVFVAAVFVVGQARDVGVQARLVVKWTLLMALGVLVVVLVISGIVIGLIQWGVIAADGPPVSYVANWLRGEPTSGVGNVPGVWGLVRNRFLLDPEILSPSLGTPLLSVIARAAVTSPIWTTLGLFALVVAVCLTVRSVVSKEGQVSGDERAIGGVDVRTFILLLLATGALLVLSVEYVYLKDHFYTRMNTVFKFYFQAWVLWAIAGAYALSRFVRSGSVAVPVVVAFLIAIGLLYPALAIPKRAAEQGELVTLDGAAYLAQAHPNDYAAITWLNEHVGDAPVILEAPGRAYDYEGRVSAHTGLPTVLGWAGHEGQWRGDYEEQGRREPDIEAIYTSLDAGQVLTLLRKYDISYVYVGPLERDRYPADGLAKFAGLLNVAYDSGSVTIYRVLK